MENRFYISTPIYYVNAEPHLGHAYTTIAADVLKRFHHLLGYETFFVTGTDEHGDKVLQAAEQSGMTPKSYVDRISQAFRDLWPRLNCTCDYFIRTTDPEHVQVVQHILQKVYDAGDIYFGQYEGLYCTGCERFYPERELENGLCPQHQRPPEPRAEKNYFFRMSKYQHWLIRHIQDHPEFVRPERYRNELLAMLQDPLEDLCISRPRARLSWGIPLPFDEQYVTYVWFDALINYISALGYPAGERFQRFWPHAQHLIAKDILKPHGVYWPTMLKAAGIAPYRSLNVHGYWSVESSKMSKSLGNVIHPLDLVDKYGLDPFRYFLMREMVFGLDASFSELSLVQRLNSELANDLGNLLQRSLTMAHRYAGGRVPAAREHKPIDAELRQKALQVVDAYIDRMRGFQFHQALISIWELIGEANRYIDRSAPFRLAKEPDRRDRLETILYHILEVNRLVAVLLWPVMPDSSERISRQLGVSSPDGLGDFKRLGRWGVLEPGTGLGRTEPLFPRVDLEKAGLLDLQTPAVTEKAARESKPRSVISMEAFERLELRVAEVVAAEAVPGSDRLLRLTVDTGVRQMQLVAGLAGHYRPEDLIGRQVVVIANLEPARIFGQLSEGMLLAAEGDRDLRLVTVDGRIEPGARVR